MNRQSAVVETRNVPEYALSVTAAAYIARERGLVNCYPFIRENRSDDPIARMVEAYGLQRFRLEELYPGKSIYECSQRMRELLFPATARPVVISPDVSDERIARAVWECLKQSRPLVFGADEEVLAETNCGEGRHALLVKRGCGHSVAAAFYAYTVGKAMRFVDEWQWPLPCSDGSEESYLLVDEFAAFRKSLLAQVLRSPGLRCAPLGVGILTAPDGAAFTRLLLRILVGRSGLEMPSKLELYRIITEHGNELHMELENATFLCGAPPIGESVIFEHSFDCRPTCPHKSRIPASSIAVQHLLISSCDTFTLGDGIVTPEFSLLSQMLDGWCSSVMAPYKHALTGRMIPVFLESLVRSGLSLGAITERLNSIAPLGGLPDPAYVLLGDPETVLAPPTSQAYELTSQIVGSSLALAATLHGAYAAELVISKASLDILAGKNAGNLALVPLCDSLRSPDVFFTFRQNPITKDWCLILFSRRELGSSRVQLALTEGVGLTEGTHSLAREVIRRLYELQAFGIPIVQIQEIEEGILAQLRFCVGYPRLIEFAVGELVIRRMNAILEAQFTEARIAVLHRFVELTANRIWISQCYGRYYSSVRREPDDSVPCPYCNCDTNSMVLRR